MLIDIITALPPFRVGQVVAAEELKKRMAVTPAVGRMIDMAAHHSGIDYRFFVIPDGDADATDKFYTPKTGQDPPDTKTRMTAYERWSTDLAGRAVEELFRSHSVHPSEIGRLLTISCTGFFAPGLDYYLIERFKLPSSVQRTHVGFMGCAASLVGFTSVLESMALARESASKVLLVSVELCSLHLQTEATRDNILANMIFADGCAAALFDNASQAGDKPQLELLWTASRLFFGSSEYMGWKIGNFGFEMILSSELPKIILEEAVPQLKEVFAERRLPADHVTHWALHPGGKAILDSLQKGLLLSDEQMAPSRSVLRQYGNMSSASILYVIKEILRTGELKRGEYVGAVAFGPGLTMEVALMKIV